MRAQLTTLPSRATSRRVGPSRQCCCMAHRNLIEQQFNARAAGYDSDLSYHKPLADKVIQLAGFKPGQKILDMACGTGLVLLPAAEAIGPSGLAVGIDVSRGMLDQAELKVQAAGLPNVQLIQGDMEADLHLLPQTQFDVITCSAAVPFLQDPVAALTAWKTLLTPGGRLVLNTFQSPNVECFDTFLAMAHRYGLVTYQDPAALLGSYERVVSALEQAGFSTYEIGTEVKTRARPQGDPVEQAKAHAERVWKAATTMNVNFGPVDESVLPDGKLAAFHDEYVQAVVDQLVVDGKSATEGFSFNVYNVLAYNTQ